MTSPAGAWVLSGGQWKRGGRPDTAPPSGGGGGTLSQRFPGDPNPKLRGGNTYWGASNDQLATHETNSGTKLGLVRRYINDASSLSAIASGGSLYTTMATDHTNNRLPCFSLKLPIATIASGGYDAQLTYMIGHIETTAAKPVWLIAWHEPEDDIAAGTFTFAQYRAAQARIRTLISNYGASHGGITRLGFGGCWMSYTWNPASGRTPDNYWPGAGVWDFLGADHYTEATATIERATPWGAYVSYCGAKNVPMTCPEWGLRKEDTSGPTKMQTFYNDMTDGTKDFVGFMYFDSNANSSGTGWQLDNTNGLLTKFDTLMSSAKTLHLSDLGY